MSITFQIKKDIKTIYENDKLIEKNENKKIFVYLNDDLAEEAEDNLDGLYTLDNCDNYINELCSLNCDILPDNLQVYSCYSCTSNTKLDFIQLIKEEEFLVVIPNISFYFDV